MARMPGAVWIGPTPNRAVGGMLQHRGLVLHIQQGTEQGSEAWFKDPASQASAHFLNPKTGPLRQLVDTDDRAWAEMAGNWYWISVENEGLSGQALTTSQVDNCGALLAWLNRVYNVPTVATDDPAGAGLGWHGMGGVPWGNHPDCPGAPVLAQRAEILGYARLLLAPPSPPALPFPPKEKQMIMVTIDTTTVPAGTPWPGIFLLNEEMQLRHVVTPADELAFKAAGCTGPFKISYQQFEGLVAGH